MIGTLLLKLAEIVLPGLIEKIFAAEEEHVSRGSGNTKRDVVHKAIIKMIIDNGIPIDANKLGDLIDAQVKVLSANHEIGWVLGSTIIKTVIECIVDQEKRDPGAADKLTLVIAAIKGKLNISKDHPTNALSKFIKAQVNMFDHFGIFTKKTK